MLTDISFVFHLVLHRPTFYRIFKKKSTEGFQAIPYSVALFSAMLMLYYAFLKRNAFMLITINSIGCAIETIYLTMYVIYASRNTRVFTLSLFIFFSFPSFNLINYNNFLTKICCRFIQ